VCPLKGPNLFFWTTIILMLNLERNFGSFRGHTSSNEEAKNEIEKERPSPNNTYFETLFKVEAQVYIKQG
jgi:hypothetical protein